MSSTDASTHWPRTLWLVRHGQSAGNVARDQAEASGQAMIDIAHRDVDVPLSALGEEQARSLGRWFGRLAPDDRPDAVYCSPYLRALQSAEQLIAGAGWAPGTVLQVTDERLREKEFGILDRLTIRGIHERHPELAEQRAHVGKFYFRPPGGESWCDVILRLRSFIDSTRQDLAGRRIVIVAHQVTVNCLRYLMEDLDEARLLAIDRLGDVPNCGVTSYECTSATGRPQVALQNFAVPLEAAGTPVTAEPDAPAAPKA